MGGSYAWFAAWAFAWALLATIAAIAFGAAPIACSLFGWDASSTSNIFVIALFFTLAPMVLNMYRVKIAAFFNNIGTVTEIIGLVVISIALCIAVIFGKGDHQSIGAIFNTGGTAAGHAWG
jgi:amino acid transporter